MMTPAQLQQDLDARVNYELDLQRVPTEAFQLTRLVRVLERLGHPQKDLRFIHVAGSKGKGTTCAFTAEILRQGGSRVGLFTSPHLWHWRERIRLLLPSGSQSDSGPGHLFPDMIPADEAAALFTEICAAEAAEGAEGRLTYFEALTVLAFCFFKKFEADVVVLETGLGGRLDATNVVDSLAAVITPVSLEHTRQLGTTLAAIAAEKAGIIKASASGQGRPLRVVMASQPDEARAVIEARVRETGGSLTSLGKDVRYAVETVSPEGQTFWVQTPRHRYVLSSPLIGAHQAANAAAAVAVLESLADELPVSVDAVMRGAAAVRWPGRFEIFMDAGKPVVLDAAHNPASARQLAETLRTVFPGRRVVLVLGISQGKDWTGIVEQLVPAAARVILTRADHPRAMPLECSQLAAYLEGRRCQVTARASEALAEARGGTRAGDVIVVTGSVFLAGEVRRLLVGGDATV